MAPKNPGGVKWGGRPCSSCRRLAGRRDGGGDVAAARRRGGRNGAQMGEYRAAAGQAAGREMPRQGPRGRLWRQGPRAAARYCQKRGISTSRRPDAHAPQSRTRAFTAAIVRGGAAVRRFAGHSPIGSVFLAWRRGHVAGRRPSRYGAASAARRPAGRMRPRSMPPSRARKARPRRIPGAGTAIGGGSYWATAQVQIRYCANVFIYEGLSCRPWRGGCG